MNNFTVKDIPQIGQKYQCYEELFDDCDISDDTLAESDHKISFEKLINVPKKMEKSQLSNKKLSLGFAMRAVDNKEQNVNKSDIKILELKSLVLDIDKLNLSEGTNDKSTSSKQKVGRITQEISGLLHRIIKDKSESFTDKCKHELVKTSFNPFNFTKEMDNEIIITMGDLPRVLPSKQ
jgi:hypothetical protein